MDETEIEGKGAKMKPNTSVTILKVNELNIPSKRPILNFQKEAA